MKRNLCDIIESKINFSLHKIKASELVFEVVFHFKPDFSINFLNSVSLLTQESPTTFALFYITLLQNKWLYQVETKVQGYKIIWLKPFLERFVF